MQDNAMEHTAKKSVNALDEVFSNQVISQGLWPL
jgi:hypothetical protein